MSYSYSATIENTAQNSVQQFSVSNEKVSGVKQPNRIFTDSLRRDIHYFWDQNYVFHKSAIVPAFIVFDRFRKLWPDYRIDFDDFHQISLSYGVEQLRDSLRHAAL